MNTISERLRFLITNEELSATDDEKQKRGPSKTLAMLERRTTISESKWRDLIRGKTRANEETIEAAGKLWPWYADWLVTGGILGVEQRNPLSETQESAEEKDDEDVYLKRGRTPESENEINVDHLLKLRQRPQGPEPMTSDTFEWGYYGAGPCELAANILFKFGLEEDKATGLRMKFAREVISSLNRNNARIPAKTIRDWIRKNA
jgi:hypothetical protein